MSEKNSFSKREWILFIIILLIIEGFIFWVSFQFAGNSSALGYVSFAGTLISIILAVLAIGYTYGESQQQKNSSNTLANQIESLIQIKEKLGNQIEIIEEISNLKKDVIDTHEKTIENIQKLFHTFKEVEQADKVKEGPLKYLNTMNYVLYEKLALLIYIYDTYDVKDWKDFTLKLIEYLKKNNQNNEVIQSEIRAMMSIWSILRNLEILTDSGYLPELKNVIADKFNKKEKHFEDLPTEIKEYLRQSS